jgi:hypothetical protein
MIEIQVIRRKQIDAAIDGIAESVADIYGRVPGTPDSVANVHAKLLGSGNLDDMKDIGTDLPVHRRVSGADG